jgi:hypothetical protein
LCLIASAGAYAQRERFVEFRGPEADPGAFNGHVKSVRIETANYSKVDGGYVEGPRRLSASVTYSPDGKRREREYYEPDGSLRSRHVHVYDDNGSQIEQSNYDGRDNLLSRVVFSPATGETLTYDGAGNLRLRAERVGDEGGGGEDRTYDGGGALLMRKVNTRESDKSVWKTYTPNVVLVLEVTVYRDGGGLLHNEQNYYNADGSFLSNISITDDQSGKNSESLYKDKNGKPGTRMRQTREFDSRGNPLKVTYYIWVGAANDFVPMSVSYFIITYYD